MSEDFGNHRWIDDGGDKGQGSATTRNRQGVVNATSTWKERILPSETGHILRHTYRTMAQRIGIDKIDARLLLDHKVPGIDGVYIHEKALFDRLLASQEEMSVAISGLLNSRRE